MAYLLLQIPFSNSFLQIAFSVGLLHHCSFISSVMPSHRFLLNSFRSFVTISFSLLPNGLSRTSTTLAFTTLKKTEVMSHQNFPERSLRFRVIPKGFISKFHTSICFPHLNHTISCIS